MTNPAILSSYTWLGRWYIHGLQKERKKANGIVFLNVIKYCIPFVLKYAELADAYVECTIGVNWLQIDSGVKIGVIWLRRDSKIELESKFSSSVGRFWSQMTPTVDW